MKDKFSIVFVLLFLVNCNLLYAQRIEKKDTVQLLNFVEAGINYSLYGPNSKPLRNLGFSVDAFHIFRKNKRINVLLGIGFSTINCFFNYIPGDMSSSKTHPYHYENEQNTSFNIVVPFFWRINFGKKTKFFIFQGVSASFGVLGIKKGIYVKDYLNKERTVYKFVGTAGLMGGLDIGIGLTIPMKKHQLIVRNTWGLYFSQSAIESPFGLPYNLCTLFIGFQF